MRLDYWNDPLVVSAFRVRFRGSTPSLTAVTFFLLLLTLGGVLHFYLADDTEHSWVQVYFVSLIILVTAVAGIYAMGSTWQSMHAEVVNRTLDYQRIAAIPPRDILIGKLIGEPAQGYLMALAGLPLLIWCCGMGAVTFGQLALLLAQVVTTAILLGTIGLIHPFDTSGDKAKVTSRTIRNVAMVIGGIYFMQLTIAMPFISQNPLAQVPLGMFTPALSIAGIAREDPLEFALPFFGWRVPYLYLTPLAQLGISFVVLHSIARRLVSPVNVALDKRTAYGIACVVDVLLAGVLLDPLAVSPALHVRLATFCIGHVGAALLIALSVTPGRECLRSWIWRFRGRKPLLQDLLFGERSENIAVLLVLSAVGVAAGILLVIMPGVAEMDAPPDPRAILAESWGPLLSMCLLILAVGSLYQLFVSIGPAGPMLLAPLLVMIVAMPHLLGAYLNEPVLMAVSPSAQFTFALIGMPPDMPLWPLLVTYGALFVAARYLLKRRIQSAVLVVDRTVAKMLAENAANEAIFPQT